MTEIQAIVDASRTRELTASEFGTLSDWVRDAKPDDILEMAKQWTLAARTSPAFSANFKVFNRLIMPHVVEAYKRSEMEKSK